MTRDQPVGSPDGPRVKGKFSKRERSAIEAGILAYLSERGETLDDFRAGFFRPTVAGEDDARQRKHYARYTNLFKRLSEAVPGRGPGAIYEAVRRMYNPLARRGRWTPEEDERLRALHAEHGPKWEVIGTLLGRDGRAVRDRVRIALNPVAHGPWQPDETQRLIAAVEQARAEANLQSQAASGARKETATCWPWVAAQVRTRNVLQCREQWQRIETIARNDYVVPKWSAECDAALARAVADTGALDVSELRWAADVVPRFLEAHAPQSAVYFPPARLRQRWAELTKRFAHSENVQDVAERILAAVAGV